MKKVNELSRPLVVAKLWKQAELSMNETPTTAHTQLLK